MVAFELAAPAAEIQEIPAGAKARMLEQPVRTLARALLEARLQRPDLLDRRLEAARYRDLLRLLGEHGVHRLEQRRNRLAAAGARRLPRGKHFVPEQRREQEPGRHAAALPHPKVGVGECEVDEALAERLLQDHVDHRQEAVGESVRAQAPQRLDRVSGKQELLHFVEQPGRGDVLDERRQLRDRRGGLRIDRDIELRREPDGAQHPHRIFAQARRGGADQLQFARANVRHAADEVPDLFLGRVEVEGVDREVAPRGILHVRAVDVVGQEAAVLVRRVVARLRRAERRHLDRFGPGMHVHEPEPAPDDEGAAKQGLHVLRPGIGGYVEVLGLDAEEEVAHRAAHDERLEPRFVQPSGDVERAAGKLLTANRVVARTVDARLPLLFAAGQEAGKQTPDHVRGAGARRLAVA